MQTWFCVKDECHTVFKQSANTTKQVDRVTCPYCGQRHDQGAILVYYARKHEEYAKRFT